MSRGVVVFDLMGTLLDEKSDYEALDAAMVDVREKHGLEVSADQLSGEFTLAFMEVLRGETPEDLEGEGAEPDDTSPAEFLPFHEAAQDIYAGLVVHHGVMPGDVDKAWFWETYLAHQRRCWRAYPEVLQTLHGLEADGWLVAVVSDADRYLVEESIPLIGLEDIVDIHVSAEESGHVKPHPRPFETVLARAGLDAASAVMVGDSYERDILGARRAGIKNGVLVDRHDARDVDVPRIRSLRALRPLLRSMAALAS